jgi:hypothetical protein
MSLRDKNRIRPHCISVAAENKKSRHESRTADNPKVGRVLGFVAALR